MAAPAYQRAIHLFAHSHELSGGGSVYWSAKYDLTPALRTKLGLKAGLEGVDLEVLASRLPKVLVEVAELALPVAYAILPIDGPTATASQPILARVGIPALRFAERPGT